MIRQLVILFLCMHLPVRAWETVKHEGMEYVTVKSMKQFYGFNSLKVTDKELILESDSITCRLPLEGTEARFNTLKIHLEFPIVEVEGRHLLSRITLAKTIDPILRPGYIRGKRAADQLKTVVIDAEPSPNAQLDEFSLRICKEVKRVLERRGFKTVVTRDGDAQPSVKERLKIINEQDAAVVLSLRAFEGGAKEEGIRSFVLAPLGVAAHGKRVNKEHFRALPGNASDSMNIALATAMHGQVLQKSGRPDRGIAREREALLVGSKHPTVLIELGNVANEFEGKILQSEEYRRVVSTGIGDGLVRTRLALRNRKADKDRKDWPTPEEVLKKLFLP